MKQYKHNTITKAQRVVAYILFTCQLLSSCGGREETIIPTIASSKQDEQCIEKDDFTTIISPKEDAESSSLTNQLPDDGIQEYSASLQPVPLSFSTNDKDCCEDEQKESEEDDYEWEWLTQDKLSAWCYSLAYKKQQEGPQQGYSDKSDTPKSIFFINSYDRNKAYYDFIDHESSIISINHSTYREYSFDHFEPKCYSFEDLSAEEKTENLLECLGYRCDAIYYPGVMNLSYKSGMSDHIQLVIKHAFEVMKVQIDEVERMSCLDENKLVINILMIDKHQRSKLLKLSNKAEENCSDELQYISNLLDTKGELLLKKESALEAEIKKKSLSLNTACILGSENLTKKIRKYIDDYNQVVSAEDKFLREDVDNFCTKIVQNTTYGSIKAYLNRWTFRSDVSEKFYLSHNKARFLDKLKLFILSINPKLNAQSELLIKLTTELKMVQKELVKHNYFFEKGGVTFSLLAFGTMECNCLQNMDVATVFTDEIKEDQGHDKEEIDKVYMLVYASDDICNACTNAIPKVQSLLSEKFHQQGVTVDPSEVDVLYLPISEKREVDLDKLIIKRIK